MRSRKNYKRIVVKIGSSLFCSGMGKYKTLSQPLKLHKEDPESRLWRDEVSCKGAKLDPAILSSISAQISGLIKEGREIVVVSSGAIALGMSALKLRERPKELSYLQAAAAIGQNELMDVYREFFKGLGLHCAQLLLTWEDFSERKRYLNAKNTLNTLLKLKSVPIINENDTVSTDEIKFGDNDRLSALVAVLVGADLLIILSDVDGLLDQDKKLIKVVDKITSSIKGLACPTEKKTCVGGMISKIEAASIAVSSGIPCVIASDHKQDIIKSLADDISSNGTLFLAQGEILDANSIIDSVRKAIKVR